MLPKRSLPSFDNNEVGMTLVEFMVAMGLSMLIAAMIFSVALTNRSIFQKDMTRTRVNQNVRSALDVVGNEVRQAGERLPSTFPAIELVDNGTASPDELIIRRNLLDDSLVSCAAISAGVLISTVSLSRAGATGVPCTYPNQRVKMTSWGSYSNSLSSPSKAYLFNQSTRAGEFIQLTGTPTADTGALIRLNIANKTPANSYVAEAASVYIINQWKFSVTSGLLQITENGDTANPRNIVDQITNFQVQLLMQDGTTLNSLTVAGNWTLIKAVRVTITGTETAVGGRVITRVLTSDFFPRNILST